MIKIRKSAQRGYFDHDWLKTFHTFSFSEFYDPAYMGFRSLRVINEDRIAPQQGFGTHPHRDMEIVTYVMEGQLSHKDSMGNGSTIKAGDVQYMSAGTGVTHSEVTDSKTDWTHLFQIWILPNQAGLKPRYDQKAVAPSAKLNRLCQIVCGEPGPSVEGAVQIRQDASIYASVLQKERTLKLELKEGRAGYLQIGVGSLKIKTSQGETHQALSGDGVFVTELEELSVEALEPTEFLWFDLA